MAEHEDGQERTEQPTPKRLEDARKKGQVVRSRELSTMLVLLSGALAVFLGGGHLLNGLTDIMTTSFQLSPGEVFAPYLAPTRLVELILEALAAIAPILAMATVVSLMAPLALGGWSLSAEAMQPKFERLDPIKGIQRVFGPKGLMEGFKAFAKFILILGFAVIVLYGERDAILSLSRGDTVSSLASGAEILFFTFVIVSCATIVIALVDVPFQLWQHHKQLRMSRQQIKDEMKETDGSPELKARVRSLQQEVARRRMMEEVPKADVVVTNPEHFAVALKFDADTMRAPVVVAKGVEDIARSIRAIAQAHDVTVMEAPPLARALYHTTKINREIPADLYLAVAKVLAYVFQLRVGAAPPSPPRDLPIPAGFEY